MEEEKKIVKNKTSKGSIITIVLLILIIIGMCIYIAYDKGVIFQSSTDVEEKDTKKETKEEKEKEETKETDTIQPLDLTKSLNTTNLTYSNPSETASNYGLSMTINPDKRTITLSINWPVFGPLSTASAYSVGVEQYQITGFSKDIESTFVGELGQDSMGLTLFFLMSDKTVEYMPMFNLEFDSQNNSYYTMNYAYEPDSTGHAGEHFKTKGALTGVNGVIKLYNVNASDGIGGARTTIGATKDGSFYDLGNSINK